MYSSLYEYVGEYGYACMGVSAIFIINIGKYFMPRNVKHFNKSHNLGLCWNKLIFPIENNEKPAFEYIILEKNRMH